MAYEWREPLKVLRDVLKAEMVLDDGHIMLAHQPWGIPQDNGLYITLQSLAVKPIGNNNYFDGGDDAAVPPISPSEIQQVVVQEMVQIDIMSFNNDARTRKEEVLMALASMACLRAQAAYNFKINRIPTAFVNASSLEETKFLNRFTVTLVIESIKEKVKAAAYYETIPEMEVHSNV